jgi:hypothetical protein
LNDDDDDDDDDDDEDDDDDDDETERMKRWPNKHDDAGRIERVDAASVGTNGTLHKRSGAQSARRVPQLNVLARLILPPKAKHLAAFALAKNEK